MGKIEWKRYIHPQTFDFNQTFSLEIWKHQRRQNTINLYEVSSRMSLIVTNTKMTGSTTNT